MGLQYLKSEVQYLFREKRDKPSGMGILIDKAPRGMEVPGWGEWSEGKWQVALISMNKRSSLWLMKGASEMLGEMGTHPKMNTQKCSFVREKPLGESF